LRSIAMAERSRTKKIGFAAAWRAILAQTCSKP